MFTTRCIVCGMANIYTKLGPDATKYCFRWRSAISLGLPRRVTKWVMSIFQIFPYGAGDPRNKITHPQTWNSLGFIPTAQNFLARARACLRLVYFLSFLCDGGASDDNAVGDMHKQS